MKGLSDVKKGSSAIIKRLDCKGAIRQRLIDLGIFEGEKIKVIALAPLCDPIIIEVKGCLMAIRKNNAGKIIVEEEENV
ncbi:MAG: ferrous iron transport protein A [Firmicutes bacterium]|nr:ferrous iron transport protein A [Bacillota bacterium]